MTFLAAKRDTTDSLNVLPSLALGVWDSLKKSYPISPPGISFRPKLFLFHNMTYNLYDLRHFLYKKLYISYFSGNYEKCENTTFMLL